MTKIIDLAEFRCKWCNRLLLKQAIENGRFEIKCTNLKCPNPDKSRLITFKTK